MDKSIHARGERILVEVIRGYFSRSICFIEVGAPGKNPGCPLSDSGLRGEALTKYGPDVFIGGRGCGARADRRLRESGTISSFCRRRLGGGAEEERAVFESPPRVRFREMSQHAKKISAPAGLYAF